MTRPTDAPLLEIEDLVVHFTTRSGIVQGARGGQSAGKSW